MEGRVQLELLADATFDYEENMSIKKMDYSVSNFSFLHSYFAMGELYSDYNLCHYNHSPV